MATTNENNLDAGSRFWADDHGGSSNKPFELTSEAVHEDTAAAYRESQGRAERDEQIERASDDVEVLRHGFGSLKDGIEFGTRLTESYKADPIGTAAWHKREYARRFPNPLPPKEADEKPPFDDLDERGQRAWAVELATKNAYRDAAREKAHREDIEAAGPALAELRHKYPNASLDELIGKAAAVHMAMETNPAVADRKLGPMFMDGQQPDQYVQSVQQAQVEAQETERISDAINYVTQSGTCPGIERQETRSKMAQAIRDQHVPVTGDNMMDLFNAYNFVTAQNAEDMARRYPEAVAATPELQTEAGRHGIAQIVRERGETADWESDLHTATEIFRQRRREAAAGARHASKSITGGPPTNYTADDITGSSIEDDVKRAMYSSRA